MFFSGQRVSAQELYRLGSVEAVVPGEQLQTAARDMAGAIAANSPIALRLGKQSLNRAEALSLEEGYRVEQDYTARISGFADSAEARDSWREKRVPRWTWS